MQVIKDEAEFRGEGSCVALGMFDGVHKGHQALIREAIRQAEKYGVKSAACTFDTHPLAVLNPSRAPKELMSTTQREEKMREMGLDVLVVRPFTPEFGNMEAEAYLEKLVREMKPKAIVVGFNYTFGKYGMGTSEMIQANAEKYGYEAKIIPAVLDEGEPVSSTLIRKLIATGETERAKRLLALENTGA